MSKDIGEVKSLAFTTYLTLSHHHVQFAVTAYEVQHTKLPTFSQIGHWVFFGLTRLLPLSPVVLLSTMAAALSIVRTVIVRSSRSALVPCRLYRPDARSQQQGETRRTAAHVLLKQITQRNHCISTNTSNQTLQLGWQHTECMSERLTRYLARAADDLYFGLKRTSFLDFSIIVWIISVLSTYVSN